MKIWDRDINLIWAVLIFFMLYMLIFGFLVNFLEPFTPQIIKDTFGYGKTATNNTHPSKIVKWIQVPKAYFTHFYIFAVTFYTILLALTVQVIILGVQPVPYWFETSLDLFSTVDRVTSTSPESVVIVMILFNLQCWRRLYECLYVNVDTGSKMNILHYIVGFVHYFCSGLGYLSEAPGFASLHSVSSTIKWIHIEPKLTNLTLLQVTLTLAFFWAWSHQFKAHKIFAELKLKSSAKHSVPYGDWFKYVSCPHYLAEILIYLIFAGILGFSHLTGWLVFGWVLTNQMVAGLMSHSWYKKNFKTYPDNRRAVIPYLI